MKAVIIIAGFVLLLNGVSQAQITFSAPVFYQVGNGPSCLAIGDLTGKKKVDIVCTAKLSNQLSILTNNGAGVFGNRGGLGVGVWPEAVAVSDFNGDGMVDIATANYGDSTLTEFTNNGSGYFAYASLPFLSDSGSPNSMLAGNFSGHGKVDLVTANYSSSSVTLFQNNGSGAFSQAGTFNAGLAPESMTSFDVNNDGKPDLIIANQIGKLTVLTNYGGGFGSNTTYNVGGEPIAVISADVNHDGKNDLIWANINAINYSLSVLTNTGSGTFLQDSTYPVGNMPLAIAAADFNGDGWVDLVSANYNDNSLTVLTNDCHGHFVYAMTISVGLSPDSIVATDVNGDGMSDIVCADYGDNNIAVIINSTRPSLSISRTGNLLAVTWPNWATNYTFQYSTNLNSGFNDLLVSTNTFLANPTNGQSFYRLILK
jgi:FG-GAP-like repeat